MPGEVVAVVNAADTDLERARLLGTTERFPDVVVVNPVHLSLERRPDDEEESIAGLDPYGAVSLARLATEEMRNRGLAGSIVVVSEIERSGPSPAATSYLRSEMMQLAREVAPNGIRVNAVVAGHVAVSRRGNVVSSRAAPLGHSSLHPVEIGKAAWFLMNDDLSGGITGTALRVDRGASLLLPEW
jgi:NAD(P)-dependent dehydrogenase (short-subunit alcohol dehydrogenase family)